MSWGATIGTGVAGAVVGGAGMFSLALLWVRWFRVSSFEGKSGYFVVFLALAGAVAGLVIAMVAARVGHAYLGPKVSAWTSQVGVGVGAVVGALLLALVISFFQADLTPDLGGRGVVVAWEVRLPKQVADAAGTGDNASDPRLWTDEELRLQLVAVQGRRSTGSEYGTLDRAAFRQEDGQWILPASVALFTSKGALCVNLKIRGRDDGFWPPIHAAEAYELATDPAAQSWSAWSRTNGGRDAKTDADAVMYRFKLLRTKQADPQTPR